MNCCSIAGGAAAAAQPTIRAAVAKRVMFVGGLSASVAPPIVWLCRGAAAVVCTVVGCESEDRADCGLTFGSKCTPGAWRFRRLSRNPTPPRAMAPMEEAIVLFASTNTLLGDFYPPTRPCLYM